MPALRLQHRELKPSRPLTGFNFVVSCGNRIAIFTRDRFPEIESEVDRLLQWGYDIDDISIRLLEEEDPFG